MKVFKEQSEQLHREVSRAQLGRWDDFRARKVAQMRNFIFAIRRQKSTAFFIQHVAISAIFSKVSAHLEERRRYRRIVQGGHYVSAVVCRYIKNRGKKYGPQGLAAKLRNQVRYSLMFAINIRNQVILAAQSQAEKDKPDYSFQPTKEGEAIARQESDGDHGAEGHSKSKVHFYSRSVIFEPYRLLLGFLKFTKLNFDQAYAVHRLIRTGRTLEKATDKMKNNYVARQVKVECFLVRWQNLVTQILATSQAKNDKVMRKFAIKIMSIPQAIKEYVAKLWVKDCCAKHMIAFLEWRKLGHLDRYGECQGLIDGRR